MGKKTLEVTSISGLWTANVKPATREVITPKRYALLIIDLA